jgi:vancomycin permeability regulator SanA
VKLLDRRSANDSDAPPEAEPSRRRSRLRRLALWLRLILFLGGLVVLYVGVTLAQVWLAAGQDSRPRSGAIVVLGAAQYNGRPSPALKARLEHALELYEDDVAPVVVVTGGKQPGDKFTEATSGYNWLRRRGVPDADLRLEVAGTSSWESLSATALFLKKEGIDEVVLVSAPSHAYRVKDIAEEVGLVAHVSPADSEGDRASIRSMARETVAVSAGRIIGYRRLGRLDSIR